MKLADPVTSITDFLLAAEAFVFAALLLADTRSQISVLLWGAAFVSVGMAAAGGALYHGLRGQLSEGILLFFWRWTAGWLLISPGLFAASGIMAAFSGTARILLLSVTAVPILFLVARIVRRKEQNFEARNSGIWILAVLLLLAAALVRHLLRAGSQTGTSILIGSMICLVAIGVQQRGIGLHKHFNQDDLCHVFFMAGLYFLYSGGALLNDR